MPITSGLPSAVQLGDTIAGKYRLDRILGAGGMGVVVGATHLQLAQPIAIKFMSPLSTDDDSGLQRFMQEARAAAHIRSEHVVRVFDVASLEGGTPYIVMEYLEGEDLQQLLAARGPLPLRDAVDYVLQACEAIAEAHVGGVVHRDLKPGNLFCCRRRDGSTLVKVLDFGISKLLPKADVRPRDWAVTGAHVVMGSPLYASPEQLGAPGAVDARSDLWSLGAILYELVGGTPPFLADTLLQLRTKIALAAPEPLRAVRPEVSPDFEALIARSLAKAPRDRFQTVADFAEALAPFAPRRALLSVERIVSIVRASASPDPAGGACPSASEEAPTSVAPSVLPCEGSGRVAKHPLRVWMWAGAGTAMAAAAVWLTAWSMQPSPAARATVAAVASAPSSEAAPPPPSAVLAPEPERERAPIAVIAPASSSAPAAPRPKPRPAPSTNRAPDTYGFGGLL